MQPFVSPALSRICCGQYLQCPKCPSLILDHQDAAVEVAWSQDSQSNHPGKLPEKSLLDCCLINHYIKSNISQQIFLQDIFKFAFDKLLK